MAWTRSLGFVTVLLGFFLLAVPVARAADTSQADTPHHQRMHGRFQERLGLSDDQMKAIREIRERQAESRRQLWTMLRNARAELRQLALKGGDEAAIKAKTAEVQKLLGQAVETRVKMLQEIAPILTPEQREKLATMDFSARWRRRGAGQTRSSSACAGAYDARLGTNFGRCPDPLN